MAERGRRETAWPPAAAHSNILDRRWIPADYFVLLRYCSMVGKLDRSGKRSGREKPILRVRRDSSRIPAKPSNGEVGGPW
jgi:hypothetical protein